MSVLAARAARSAPHDSLSRGQQRAVVGAIVLLHVGLGWALLQVQAVREVVAEAAPMFVDLIAPPAPPPPVPVPIPPPPPTQRVVQKAPPPPVALITAAPSPAPATFTAPLAAPEPPAPPMPPAPPAAVTVQAPPAPPAPPPQPKMLPASAVVYLQEVLPVYSSASARAKESGKVVVRVYIDEAGMPQDVRVYQSSGFVRLDEAWVAAIRKSRFKPYVENGQPTGGWALAPFSFEF